MLLNKKILRNIVVLTVLLLSVNYVYAELSCSLTYDLYDSRSCSYYCPSENLVFYMHALNDSQVSSVDGYYGGCPVYVYDVCCESEIVNSTVCDGSNTVIKLGGGSEPYGPGNGMTNAHVAYANETLPAYSEEVCFGNLDCFYSASIGCVDVVESECLASMSDSTNAHLAECDYFLPRTSYYPEPGGNICCNDVSCNYYEGLYCETGNDICMGSASVDIMVSIGICNTYLPPTYPQGRNICCDGYNCQFSDQTECSDLQSHICVASVESFFLINPVCNSYLPDTPTGTNICCRERCAANLGEVCTGDTNCCDGYCSDYGLRTDYTKGPLPPEDWHCCPSGDAWFASDGICSQFAECYAPEPIVDVCNYNNTNETGYWTDPDCFRTLPPELSVPNQACCGVDWYGNLTFDYDDIYVYPWNYSG